ncbi:RNA polymerase sigma-70 factor [Parabacteroides sp. AM08-6]|uniref:RNA polymerase sigma-70 factor n=1 Tax=Parabacteroides sp. AM08-6 TaxID=2292053 RepID=UPI000EFF7672|nr:RNA polymerase sigma-70 factor [Parabacteroides sp. AM08-6]RHJ83911.1 RNA polymerase sigma-70 factor [Parabacteroides sp. AM08-6]
MGFSINDLQKGNEQALTQLVSLYWGRLYKLAVTFVLDTEVAKEIVQDAFLAVWEKRETFDVDCNLLQYLFRIVRNKSFNYLRGLQLETIPVELLEQDNIYMRSNLYLLEDTVVESLFLQDLEEIIQQSLQKLSLQSQEIFMLSRKENMSNKEIAQIMHLSQKAVEFHISKAIRQIKHDLPEEYHFKISLF